VERKAPSYFKSGGVSHIAGAFWELLLMEFNNICAFYEITVVSSLQQPIPARRKKL
jgi:hypothetical protein